MLNIRSVDDQSYEEIVTEAKERLPWLCPVWTDHNAHDPGVTLLELMAWYKELQQFYMDQTTPAIRRRMLELAGCAPLRAQRAECGIEIAPDDPGRPRLSRLRNEQGTEFELLEPVPEKRCMLVRTMVESRSTGRRLELGSLIDGGVSFRPFCFGGVQDTELLLGFSDKPEREMRIWCEVQKPDGTERNRPAADSVQPRTLVWKPEGCGAVKPLHDETWALSWSGYITLPVPKKWAAGEDGLFWLRLREMEPGCEGEVRLKGFSMNRYRCAQQHSRAKSYAFRIGDAADQTVTLVSAQAAGALVQVFLRRAEGWERVERYEETTDGAGAERTFTLDGSGSAQDGRENLIVVCCDAAYAIRLSFLSRGLPEESFFLDLGGQYAMGLTLICPTLAEDGVVRPALWHEVNDLSVCSKRDRVFLFDQRRESIRFGDGAHGCVPAPGEILVAELSLSRCAAGNVSQDAGLCFESDGTRVPNSGAQGGRNPETPEEAGIRLRRRLQDTPKCETAEDFERCAQKTPGLRVACAKALPDCDVYQNGLRRRSACVSVVVLPDTDEERPMPDQRFLDAVDRQLALFRPVCIHARAVPPRYVPITLSAELFASPDADENAIREAVQKAFRPCTELIGRTLRRDEVIAKLQKLPGVLQVRRLELWGADQNSYRSAAGDLELPPNGLPVPEKIELTLTDALT